MRQSPIVITTALVLVLAFWPAANAARVSDRFARIEALAPAVEAAVARTRPRHWPMKRACLYYALAGQALLAKQGISAQLRVGDVVYRPGTARAYAIGPHAWLETGREFIDYATLPRWGRASVIPADLVADNSSRVVPGVTQVLTFGAMPDSQVQRYLSHHYRCFHGRWMAH